MALFISSLGSPCFHQIYTHTAIIFSLALSLFQETSPEKRCVLGRLHYGFIESRSSSKGATQLLNPRARPRTMQIIFSLSSSALSRLFSCGGGRYFRNPLCTEDFARRLKNPDLLCILIPRLLLERAVFRAFFCAYRQVSAGLFAAAERYFGGKLCVTRGPFSCCCCCSGESLCIGGMTF